MFSATTASARASSAASAVGLDLRAGRRQLDARPAATRSAQRLAAGCGRTTTRASRSAGRRSRGRPRASGRRRAAPPARPSATSRGRGSSCRRRPGRPARCELGEEAVEVGGADAPRPLARDAVELDRLAAPARSFQTSSRSGCSCSVALLERLSQLQTSITDGRPSARAALITSGSGPPSMQRDDQETRVDVQASDRLGERRAEAGSAARRRGTPRPAARRPRVGARGARARALTWRDSPEAGELEEASQRAPPGPGGARELRAEKADEVGGRAEQLDRGVCAPAARAGVSTVGRADARAGPGKAAGATAKTSSADSASPRKSSGSRFTGGGLVTTSSRGARFDSCTAWRLVLRPAMFGEPSCVGPKPMRLGSAASLALPVAGGP